MHEHLKATAKNGIQSRQRVTELDWQITMNLIIKVSSQIYGKRVCIAKFRNDFLRFVDDYLNPKHLNELISTNTIGK